MAFGNRRQIEIERRKMRMETAIVDSSAVAGSAAVTGLSSNTPNLLVSKSSAEITFTFAKQYTEAPVVLLTDIGAHTVPAYVKVTPTATGFIVVTDTGAEDFMVQVLGSEKPVV